MLCNSYPENAERAVYSIVCNSTPVSKAPERTRLSAVVFRRILHWKPVVYGTLLSEVLFAARQGARLSPCGTWLWAPVALCGMPVIEDLEG